MKTFKAILLPVSSISIIIVGSWLLTHALELHIYWLGMFIPVLMISIVGLVYLAAKHINKIPE
jgi:hypothetical protein